MNVQRLRIRAHDRAFLRGTSSAHRRRQTLRQHGEDAELPHMQEVDREYVEEAHASRGRTRNGPKDRHKGKRAVRSSERLAEGCPRIRRSTLCRQQLRLQSGNEIPGGGQLRALVEGYLAAGHAEIAESLAPVTHQGEDSTLRNLIDHQAGHTRNMDDATNVADNSREASGTCPDNPPHHGCQSAPKEVAPYLTDRFACHSSVLPSLEDVRHAADGDPRTAEHAWESRSDRVHVVSAAPGDEGLINMEKHCQLVGVTPVDRPHVCRFFDEEVVVQSPRPPVLPIRPRGKSVTRKIQSAVGPLDDSSHADVKQVPK